MARRPASGRGWTDDGRATGKSFRDPVEAWWKHEGENRCAILTIRAQAALADPVHNWRKPRKNSRSCATVHGSFDTTHNLKAAGSNPAPATKILKYIRRLEPDVNRQVFGVPLYINATSTLHQKSRSSTDNHAVAGSGRQCQQRHPASCALSLADKSRREAANKFNPVVKARIRRQLRGETVDFHPELSRFFHREVSHL